MSSGLHPNGDALRATLDLFELGLGLMRQNLRRADLLATEQEIEDRLQRWLQHRPGAEFGDSPGRLRDLSDRSE